MSKAAAAPMTIAPVLSGSAIYLGSNLVNAAIPFALLPVLTRYLEPHEYGAVAMFQALLGGLGAFVGVGVAAAMTRRHFDLIALPMSATRDFLASALQVLLVTALIAFGASAALGDWLSSVLGLDRPWILGAVIVSAAGVVTQIRLAQWQVRGAAFSYGGFQIGQSLANMLLSLVLVVAMHEGANGRIGAQSIAAVVAAVLALWWLRRDSLLSFFVWRPEQVKEVLSYGLPLMPHVLAAFVLLTMDRLVINAELGLASAGVYMVAFQLASGVSLVFDAISRAYTPWLFEHLQRNDARQKRQVVQATYVWFAVILVAAMLTFLAGPWLVATLAGKQYAEAGAVVGWLILGQAFMGMYLLLSGYLLFSKRTGLLSSVTVLSALVYAAVLLMLVRHYGLRGAAVAFAAGMGFRLVLIWWAAQRCHPMPWLAGRTAR